MHRFTSVFYSKLSLLPFVLETPCGSAKSSCSLLDFSRITSLGFGCERYKNIAVALGSAQPAPRPVTPRRAVELGFWASFVFSLSVLAPVASPVGAQR